MQRRIATVTVNAALDVASVVPQLMPERKLRCEGPTREAGGGGVNVARGIHALGGEATACVALGGATGEVVRSLLEAEGVAMRVVRTQEWTRENVNIVERSTGNQYRFCMPGPRLAEAEWQQLIEQAAGVEPELVVVSGSLAAGVPTDFYARAAKRLGGRIIVDTSGDALLACRGIGVYLIKASLREFATLIGATRVDEGKLRQLAAQAVAGGVCEVLVVSLGAGGALWTTATEQQRLLAPAVEVRSSVGAGDTMVAGVALALARGGSLAEAVRYGVAAGSATVMQPGTALCRREDVERLLPQVRVA